MRPNDNNRDSSLGPRASNYRAPGTGLRASERIGGALVISVVLVAGIAAAQDVDARAQAIAAKLRCPVCQNESVADSPSELAAQMRMLIREKLASGETDDQIVAYFVTKYGEWILLEPSRRGLLWVLWVTPPLALLIAAYVVVTYLRRTVRTQHRVDG